MAVKTYMAKKGELKPQWYLVDATDKIVGRLAAKLARILQGKHRPEYTPHVDTGAFVIVVNVDKVRVTGNHKLSQRMYKRYSGYPGGLRQIPLSEMLKKHPDRVLNQAVRRMLPKTPLGRNMMLKLKVYSGPSHEHQAQQPQPLDL
jgi:large subunit ribosomal protein L13